MIEIERGRWDWPVSAVVGSGQQLPKVSIAYTAMGLFMEKRLCAACRHFFRPRPQVPRQSYCRAPACQRERRLRWQEAKRRTDPDYRENQRHAQKAWCERNADYWRDYRRKHPEYRERNKAQQRVRNLNRMKGAIAKKDVSAPTGALQSGLYRIVPSGLNGIAKTDVWIAEITWISESPSPLCGRCKERT